MITRPVAGGASHPAGRRWRGFAVALGAMAIALPAMAQELAYTGSVHMATGEYLFTERTTSFAFLNGLALTQGRFRLSATIPLYSQNSTAVSFVNGIPVPTGGPEAIAVREREPGKKVPMGSGRGGHSGDRMGPALQTGQLDATDTVTSPGSYSTEVGDPTLQAGFELLRGNGAMRTLGVYGVAKAPLADVESGLGTGEWDFGGGANLGFGGASAFLFADVSYWVNGDLPDLPLRNTVNYGVTVGRWLGSGRWSLSASLLGASSMIEGVDAPVSVGIGFGYSAARGRMFSGSVGAGLTESAADVSSYVGWRLPLGRTGP